MSEVKAQGAPGRIWATLEKEDKVGKHCRLYKGKPYETEYIRADIARELAEALEKVSGNLHHHQASSGGDRCSGCGLDLRHPVHYRSDESATQDIGEALLALDKWREATEEGS